MAQPSDTVPVEKYRALIDKLELLEQELGQKTVAMLSQVRHPPHTPRGARGGAPTGYPPPACPSS